ncbi:glutathione S-transferase [Melanomma pulvis-pyrius CBS 109.77]|uniref:glutathione transferase n=1 Tax=Melanomma pulvis-pyrius CBS 109.77 TaxID=1314802 RepID=A0A6A6XRH6_9PLEO|nr:glutathione S-transferase [Melanomma pulvis-pyrius CBS 109.77]
MTKPIKVHMCPAGPNPWKVVIVLEELGVPYEVNSFPFQEVKSKPFTDLNPNGRAPAIEDPNTGITLWETGAIIQYIIEVYDTNHVLSYSNLKERSLCNQYLAFQISGQGPYFGQAGWFNVLHPEKLPSAIERYNTEIKRVLGVLETVLDGKKWLVGDNITFADLAFSTWNDRIDSVLLCAPEAKFDGFPNVKEWHERMISRPSWKVCMGKRSQLMDEQGLLSNGMPKGISNIAEYEVKIKADAEATARI